MSHPMWVRGLKQNKVHTSKVHLMVAPYVGAWIETSWFRWCAHCILSHPMWVRGLKQTMTNVKPLSIKSHPMWVRGLKPLMDAIISDMAVAPYVGAWIETSVARTLEISSCRTLCGCVD